MKRTTPILLGGLLGLAACSGDDRPAYARSTEARGPSVIEPAPTPYVPIAVTQAGTVVGSVGVAGAAPDDAPVTVSRDHRVCGNTITQITVSTRDGRLAGALVWLSNIRTGKPVSIERRFELVQERCTYDPFVQAVTAGGTLNVRTTDPVISRSVVVDARTRDTLLVVPFTDAGEVVPIDVQLRRPALLEVRSTTHPWMRAWVAVLDHPYVTKSDSGGRFTIENVPPGTYAVRAWHPRFGMTTDSVTVRANSVDTADVVLGATAPEAGATR